MPPPTLLQPNQFNEHLAASPSQGVLGQSGRDNRNSNTNVERRKTQVLSALQTYFPDNPNAWAGIMGNIEGENTLFDYQQEEKGDVQNRGYGLFQFTGPQRTKYFEHLRDTGTEDSAEAQVGHMYNMLYGANPGHEIGNTKRDRIRQSINIGTGYDVSDSWVSDYEIPADVDSKKAMRRGYTRGWMEKLNVLPPQSKPTPRKTYGVMQNRAANESPKKARPDMILRKSMPQPKGLGLK